MYEYKNNDYVRVLKIIIMYQYLTLSKIITMYEYDYKDN